MHEQKGAIFLSQLNDNLNIAYKICRVYFEDKEDRADAYQEMMYQLWKSYKDFRGNSKFSTWMYAVCLNTALTYHKKRARREETIRESHLDIPELSDGKEDRMKALFNAIGLLSPLNKAITLLYLEDQSYEEMAVITGLSKSNISVRLVRIKRELEQILRSRDFD
jgi:RNA polymerase sigma factor (sigma-70 family)